MALATAEVIGGLGHSAPLMSSALTGATDGTIGALVSAAVLDFGSRSHPDGLGVSRMPQVRLDAAPLGRMLDAIALNGDTDMRALAFASASGAMGRIRDGDSLHPGHEGAEVDGDQSVNQIRRSLTRVLDSDTTGVVERLDANNDIFGDHLSTFLESMIESGNISYIRCAIARLQLGNGLDETLEERFGCEDRVSTDPYVLDAQLDRSGALGHFAGSLVMAFDNRETSREEKADRLVAILDLATDRIPVPGGGSGSTVLSGLTQRAARAILDTYAAGEKEMGETVFELARPRTSPDHYYEGNSIKNGPFETSRNSVIAGNNTN